MSVPSSASNEVVMLANASKVIIRTKYNMMIVLPRLVLSQSMQPPTTSYQALLIKPYQSSPKDVGWWAVGRCVGMSLYGCHFVRGGTNIVTIILHSFLSYAFFILPNGC